MTILMFVIFLLGVFLINQKGWKEWAFLGGQLLLVILLATGFSPKPYWNVVVGLMVLADMCVSVLWILEFEDLKEHVTIQRPKRNQTTGAIEQVDVDVQFCPRWLALAMVENHLVGGIVFFITLI